jgi:hypothetical protein
MAPEVGLGARMPLFKSINTRFSEEINKTRHYSLTPKPNNLLTLLLTVAKFLLCGVSGIPGSSDVLAPPVSNGSIK